jgi:hypothetical protein
VISKEFEFSSEVWVWNPHKGSWYFIRVPQSISQEIKEGYPFNDRGFGSVPVDVIVGASGWKTSIFPDSKTKTYVLPIKANIRKQESIQSGDTITARIIISF